MASARRDILDIIEEIAGEASVCQVRRACAGRRVNLGVTALLGVAHPFRRVLDPEAMAELIEHLRSEGYRRGFVCFPKAGESEYVRQRRRRAALIRRLICDGHTVRATAHAAKVHTRTVTYHRARMRAEGLLPRAAAYV